MISISTVFTATEFPFKLSLVYNKTNSFSIIRLGRLCLRRTPLESWHNNNMPNEFNHLHV